MCINKYLLWSAKVFFLYKNKLVLYLHWTLRQTAFDGIRWSNCQRKYRSTQTYNKLQKSDNTHCFYTLCKVYAFILCYMIDSTITGFNLSLLPCSCRIGVHISCASNLLVLFVRVGFSLGTAVQRHVLWADWHFQTVWLCETVCACSLRWFGVCLVPWVPWDNLQTSWLYTE